MYDNSRQRSVVLPLVAAWVGAGLVGMVVRRIRAERREVPARDASARRGAATGSRLRAGDGHARGPVG